MNKMTLILILKTLNIDSNITDCLINYWITNSNS